MRKRWFTLGEVIATTAAVTLAYLLGVLLELRLEILMALFLATFAVTVWMVIRILKDPYTTDKTFDEYFYQDRDDIRRTGTE